MPKKGEIALSVDLELELADVQPGVAGPKRPQDRINLPDLGDNLPQSFASPWRMADTASRPRANARYAVHSETANVDTESATAACSLLRSLAARTRRIRASCSARVSREEGGRKGAAGRSRD